MGHTLGDEVLVSVARRLEGVAGSADSEGKGLLRALVRGRLSAEHGVMDAAAPALGRLEQDRHWPR